MFFRILIGAISIVFLFGFSSNVESQEVQRYKDLKENSVFRVVFYNTENFFTPSKDSLRSYNESMPGITRHWTPRKYRNKLQNISKVLMAIGEWNGCDLIGLSEIENFQVLNDLTKGTPLKYYDYGIIHKKSPDPRGIDVALLYKKTTFKPVYYQFYKINYPFDSFSKTRDIIYVKGVIIGADTIHVFVNHWPSRLGKSENKRLFVASVLKKAIDSIMAKNSKSNIIILGDFNDNPTDQSIQEVIGAKMDSNNLKAPCLYDFMYYNFKRGEGTLKYTYIWDLFDQIIVSCSMFDKTKNSYCRFNDAHIFSRNWMMMDDKKYPGKKPKRTFNGSKYLGGYSDHLPVYLDIHLRK